MAVSDDDRSVQLGDEDYAVLPDQTTDESDVGWGRAAQPARVRARPALSPRDRELLDERPPHWA